MKYPLRLNYRSYSASEKIEVAFLFQAATVWPSWESVYYAMKSDKRFDVRLFLVAETAFEVAHSKGAKGFLIDEGIQYEVWNEVDEEQYHPHIVFIQFPYDAAFHPPEMLSLEFVKKGCRVVYIPYGIEIADTDVARRDHFNSRVIENAWRIYTSCEQLKYEYIKYCRNRRAVRTVGSPRFDALNDRKRFKLTTPSMQKIGKRKIVVWKMHFPKKNKIEGTVYMITPELEEYILFAKHLCDFNDLFFIVLPHPKMLGRMASSDVHGDNTLRGKIDELMEIINSCDNAYVDSSMDYRNTLYNADAIIIDRSSTMVEAAMLDVPILYMQNSEFTEPLTPPIKAIMDECEHGTTSDDMLDFLDRFSKGKQLLSEKRYSVIESVFSTLDGQSGQRIVDDIVRGITEEDINRDIDIVIYGCGEVANYYLETQKWSDRKDFNIIALVDSNKEIQGKDCCGYIVKSPEELTSLQFDYIIITTEQYYYDIQQYLVNEIYIDPRAIMHIDEFLVERSIK